MRRIWLFSTIIIVSLNLTEFVYGEEFDFPDRSFMQFEEQKVKDIGKPQEPGGGILLSGDCSDYIDLTGQPLPIRVGGTTAGSSNNYGPFPERPYCWEGSGWWTPSAAAPDVTYKWTAPTAGRYTITLCGSSYDTALLLFNFTCPNEPVFPDDFICGNDDYCGFQSNLPGYWLDEGQEIFIVVDGYGNGAGMYSLEIAAYKTPAIDSFIVETMNSYHIPGLAACVVIDSEVVWTGSYGYADISQGIAVTDTTNFMLASISKTIVGTAVMQLCEEDLINLTENINNYLPFQVVNPNFPATPITVEMLMTHSSSIKDNWTTIESLLTWGGDSPIPLDTFLVNYLVPGGYYYNSNTNFYAIPPGQEWHYSNVAYTLLAYLVETVADSFPSYCQDSIFVPLSMGETSWFLQDLNIDNIAIPYQWSGGSYSPYGHYGCPLYPAGWLRTSPSHLANFLIAYMNYGQFNGWTLLDSATVDQMTIIQPGLDPITWYLYAQGLTWLNMNWHGRWIWGHSGGYYGVCTDMWYKKDGGWGLITLSNIDANDGYLLIYTELQEFAAGWPYGHIAGIVTDESMNPVEGVLVSTVGPGIYDYSDISGDYFIQYLNPGSHDIVFSHDNYIDTIVTGVAITAGDTAILHVQMTLAGCEYVTGDVNGSDNYNGLDITYGVNFFKGIGPDPVCPECGLCPDWWYCGDVNASCNYNGLDITYGVNYLKFGSPAPLPCADCPPLE